MNMAMQEANFTLRLVTRTVLCVFTLLHICYGEPFFLNRDHSDINLHHKPAGNTIKIQTEADCEMYLCDYGYLNCTCTPRTIRHRRDATRGQDARGTPFDFMNLGELSETDNTPVLPDCTVSEITEGFIRFQKRFTLDETGRCDANTKTKMNKPRCGNKDLDIVHASQENKETTTGSTTTLASILRRSAETQGVAHSKGTGAHERRRRSILENMRKADEEMKKSGKKPRIDTEEELEAHSRNKRSLDSLLSKRCIIWRLSPAYQSVKIPTEDQRYALHLAFRLWAEVSPYQFEEDTTSGIGDVDVWVGFSTGSHMNCAKPFDGLGGVVAHSVFPLLNIHFDDDEAFVSRGSNGIQLVLVAAHEIGHILGLNHLMQQNAVMFGDYEVLNVDDIELHTVDRNAVKEVAGACKGSFNTVFDWVRLDSVNGVVYNTYFMRSNQYWMYQNVANRPRYGDPLETRPFWGVHDVDAFLQLWLNPPQLDLEYYFFAGEKIHQYDAQQDAVVSTMNISEKWPGMQTNVDAAFFDYRDHRIYIFKDSMVQIWDGLTNLYLQNTTICAQFPPQAGLTDTKYCDGIDSVYFSFYSQELLFWKGEQYWTNVVYSMHSDTVTNMMGPPDYWYNRWNYICDVQPRCRAT